MTSCYEYSSDFLNIIIYGIKKEVLFPINYDLPTSMKIDQMVPDILQKYRILLYPRKQELCMIQKKSFYR